MIFYDTISEDKISIGNLYSIIGENYQKNEYAVTIIEQPSSGIWLDDDNNTWTTHGFAEYMPEYYINRPVANSASRIKYCKYILCNQLYRIIPI
jgi:hypothetical protein